MNVKQLFRLLGITPYVEVVVTRLPQWSTFGLRQLPGDVLLQHLQPESVADAGWLTHQDR